MQVDINHVLFWMDAIRNSEDPVRTLESFWKGQIRSKEWLLDNLCPRLPHNATIDIHGGWNGVLASMLFQKIKDVKHIRSVDIDPSCENTANTMNKLEEIEGRFRAVTADMCAIRSDADVIINTSCEHITQDQYDLWLSGLPYNSIIVLQSNNYNIPEHVRTVCNLEEFKQQSSLKILWSGELELPLYTRFMIIGTSDV
jgi:tRNA1(Val) A37 N6-methylase TrmN6